MTVFAFDLEGGRIKHIWAMRNPEKLRSWTEPWWSAHQEGASLHRW